MRPLFKGDNLISALGGGGVEGGVEGNKQTNRRKNMQSGLHTDVHKPITIKPGLVIVTTSYMLKITAKKSLARISVLLITR